MLKIDDNKYDFLSLNKRENKVLNLRIYERKKFKEIAKEIGVCEARASSIFNKTLRKIARKEYYSRGIHDYYEKFYNKIDFTLKFLVEENRRLREDNIKLLIKSNQYEKENNLEYSYSKNKYLDINLSQVDMINSTYASLTFSGLNSLKDLTNKTEKEMLEIKKVGKKTLNELKIILYKYGLNFKK